MGTIIVLIVFGVIFMVGMLMCSTICIFLFTRRKDFSIKGLSDVFMGVSEHSFEASHKSGLIVKDNGSFNFQSTRK